MKKSDLYFIYGLLFTIISNVADNKLMVGLAAICAVVWTIASLVLSFSEDKYN